MIALDSANLSPATSLGYSASAENDDENALKLLKRSENGMIALECIVCNMVQLSIYSSS